MKLLQIVWNFPDTAKCPFDMYYFYWPVREAVLRGWYAEVLTFQVTNDQPSTEIIDGIRVHRCPAGVHKGKPFSWPFIHALLTTDADIIHAHGYAEGRSELAILLARLRRRRVIFTPHINIYPYRRPMRELYDMTIGRFLFNLSDRVIVFTEYTYQQLLNLGVRREKLRIVPHVSRPDIMEDRADEDADEKGRLLREAGITGNPLILGVGRLIRRKGWEYTVHCLPSIVARFPDAKLLIMGPSLPEEPSFPQWLMGLAEDLGVRENLHISLHNSPEFIRDAYRSATILTHPSLVESFGVVLLEAMTAGLPIVAHNGTGLPCIVDDGETGYVVDVHDVPKYTDALLSLLNNSALRQEMGAEGKRQSMTRFGQAEVAAQLFEVFTEVQGSTPHNDPAPILVEQTTSVHRE